jgi:hypothetical protein
MLELKGKSQGLTNIAKVMTYVIHNIEKQKFFHKRQRNHLTLKNIMLNIKGPVL